MVLFVWLVFFRFARDTLLAWCTSARRELEDKFDHTHQPSRDTDNFTRLDRWYIPKTPNTPPSYVWNICPK